MTIKQAVGAFILIAVASIVAAIIMYMMGPEVGSVLILATIAIVAALVTGVFLLCG